MNLLRNTAACYAAGLGGADAITSVPFDAVIGLPDAFSRRVARNTVLVLQEEARLHRVIDPAGGSWYLGWLTDQVAEKAWGIFQEIERGGRIGMHRNGCVAEHCLGTGRGDFHERWFVSLAYASSWHPRSLAYASGFLS